MFWFFLNFVNVKVINAGYFLYSKNWTVLTVLTGKQVNWPVCMGRQFTV